MTTIRTIAINDAKEPVAAVTEVVIKKDRLSIAMKILKKAIINALMKTIEVDSSTPPTTND